MPGTAWLAPTHVYPLSVNISRTAGVGVKHATQVRIVFSGNASRKGSSLPTPFCMITSVVSLPSMTGRSFSGTEF